MQSTRIRYFLEAARAGSLRLAAEKLNVAPSAVSRQVMKLEDQLGESLFERHVRGVVLTAAGKILVEYARRSALDWDRMKSELDELRGLRRGNIHIITIEGIVAGVLGETIAIFREQYSNITFQVTILGTDEVVQGVRSGEADLGIAFNASAQKGVAVVSRNRHPLLAVAAPNYPLAQKRKITLAEVLNHPVAVPANTFGTRHLIDAVCKAERLKFEPVLVTNSIEALRVFARFGCGVTILSDHAIVRELSERKVIAVPLADRLLRDASLDICIAENRVLTRATKAFLAMFEDNLRERRMQVRADQVISH